MTMGELLNYMLQVSIIMTCLYLGYKWWLSGSTYHLFNRGVLIGIIVVSWSVPMLLRLMQPHNPVDVEIAVMQYPVVAAQPPTPSNPITVWQVLVLMYMAGCVVALAYNVHGFARLYRIIKSGRPQEVCGTRVIVSAKAPGPFSWGGLIVLRPCDCDADAQMVVSHEVAHSRRLHWLDLLVCQFTLVFQWYNPSAWLLMRELKNVHEFQADLEAASSDVEKYQRMLLKKTVGAGFPSFADSLNHSQLKTRLTMMMKRNSSQSHRLAVLALPAMALAGVWTLAIPSVASVLGDIRSARMPEFSADKVTNSAAHVQIPSAVEVQVEGVPAPADATVEIVKTVPNDQAAPTSTSEDKCEEAPSTPAYFVNGELFTGNLTELEPSRIKSMTIVKNDPAYPQGKIMIELGSSEGRPAAAAEKIADFKGGMPALREYMSSNLRMPDGVQLTESKRVVVQFTVGADGSISDVRLVRASKIEALDAEATRFVKSMSGMWEPATINGKAIDSKFTIPVLFKK